MRTIKTKDGQVYSGWNSDFIDKGTHIEQNKGMLSGTTERIYKENIASDQEIDTAGNIAISVIVLTIMGGFGLFLYFS